MQRLQSQHLHGCQIKQVSRNAAARPGGRARQVAIVVYTDRRQAHPLILSTCSPAVAMPLSGPSAGSPGRKLGGGGDRLWLVLRRRFFSSDIAFSSVSTKVGFFSGITFSSASTEVGDARNLAERSEHTSGQRHLGVLGPTLGLLVRVLRSWSRGLAGLGARTRTRSPRASSRSPCSSHSTRSCT